MKHVGLLLFALLLLMSTALAPPAYAFSISFAYKLCALPVAEIKQSVSDFSDKLIRVRSLYTRGSAYRKHVERHARELRETLATAVTGDTCSVQQTKSLAPLQQAFEALYLRNKSMNNSP